MPRLRSQIASYDWRRHERIIMQLSGMSMAILDAIRRDVARESGKRKKFGFGSRGSIGRCGKSCGTFGPRTKIAAACEQCDAVSSK